MTLQKKKNESPSLLLNIYSWNLNGLKALVKSNKVHLHLYRNPGIWCFQEIHDPAEYEIKRISSNGFLYIKKGNNHTNGVALSIPNLNPNITHQPSSVNRNDNNESIILAIVKWFDLELLIVNIYAPAGAAKERESFFKTLSEILDQFSDKLVLLLGDFNCVLDTDKDRPIKENQQKYKGKDQVELEKLVLKHNLIDSFRYMNEFSTACTFGRSIGNKISRIDRIYVSEYLTNLLQKAEITKHTASDHDICSISLKTPDNLIISKSNWRLNKKVLQQRKYQNLINLTLTTHLNNFTQDAQQDIIEWYGKLKYSLLRKSRRYTIGHSHNVTSKILEIRKELKKLDLRKKTLAGDSKLTENRLRYQ